MFCICSTEWISSAANKSPTQTTYQMLPGKTNSPTYSEYTEDHPNKTEITGKEQQQNEHIRNTNKPHQTKVLLEGGNNHQQRSQETQHPFYKEVDEVDEVESFGQRSKASPSIQIHIFLGPFWPTFAKLPKPFGQAGPYHAGGPHCALAAAGARGLRFFFF